MLSDTIYNHFFNNVSREVALFELECVGEQEWQATPELVKEAMDALVAEGRFTVRVTNDLSALIGGSHPLYKIVKRKVKDGDDEPQEPPSPPPLVGLIKTKEDFEAEVHKLRKAGWEDPNYMARQIVDDYYRHTGVSLHHVQHIVEELVRKCP